MKRLGTRIGRNAVVFGIAVSVWIVAAPAAFAQQTGSGMKGYWNGDDGTSPTTAADSSGNLFNGTYQNGATTSTSVPTLLFPDPTSMTFNGSNSSVSIPSFTFDGTGPVTIAFWNFVATANVQNSSAFSIGNQDAPNRCQAHAPWSDKWIYWDYGNYNTNSGRVSANYTTYLDKWTHVALVSTGSGGAFQGIYLDGVLAVSSTTPVGPTVTFTGATLGAWTGAGLYHKGGIDDFRIYNRVLSAQDISALAAGNCGPAAPTGLAGVPG
ncbi:MAG TPA: LamG domain-containing protein, partial [Planctomycetota bacterium]|nr:LamG domain-containing protein [Planctomycetota bacterium]